MTFPLIHIGYHKTGSSWLQKRIFNQENWSFVSPFSRDKEIGEMLIYVHPLDFAPKACGAYFLPRITKAKNAGLMPVISYERLSGDFQSGGYDSKEIADRLIQVFPEAKIFVVIREQKSMALSMYKQYIVDGGTNSLKRFLFPTTMGKGRIPLFSFDHLNYHRLIKYYMQIYGRENVCVLTFEAFKANRAEFLGDLFSFLGDRKVRYKDIEKANSDRVNASLSILALNIKRRLNWLFADDRINPNALVPSAHLEKKITWYLQKVDNIALARLSNSFEQKLKAQIDKLIGGIYRKSNGITSSIISKDLGKLGYDI